MRRSLFCLAGAGVAAAGLVGCVGDDTEVVLPSADASFDATGVVDANLPLDAGPIKDGSPVDSSHDAPSNGGDAGDAGADAAPSTFLLVTETATFAQSTLVALDVARGTGTSFSYAGGGVNVATTAGPWALEQSNDLVVRLDPNVPATPLGSWSVAEPSDAGGFFAHANPYAVAEVGAKAYVALFNRNVVPVLDTTQSPDAGAPAKTIDLRALLQDGGDGNVEASAAFYDATRKRVWLVLGNLHQGGNFLACVAGLKSEVVAIDTTTDALLPQVYPLTGYNPSSVVYDPAGDRLLVMNAGCNAAFADGGEGALTGASLEQIALATGQSTTLVDTREQGGYGSLLYVDAHHAFVSFAGYPTSTTYAWDPAQTTLGAMLQNTPDGFVWDGHALLGPKQIYLADGGLAQAIAEEVDPATGVATQLVTFPVFAPGDYWESVGLWPPQP
ncbi:MAG TPA: hypothetical protein VGI39_41665 [Polyangiaceae bacterium]|jgi:hypothetical protein